MAKGFKRIRKQNSFKQGGMPSAGPVTHRSSVGTTTNVFRKARRKGYGK